MIPSSTRPPGHLTSSEYAAHAGVVKSRVSRWLKDGLPFVEGKDDHGRTCRYIDPAVGDDWRGTFLTPVLDGNAELRGVVHDTPQRTPIHPSAPPAPKAGGDDGAPVGPEPAPPDRLPPPAPPVRLSDDGAGGGQGHRNGEPASVAQRIQESRASEAEDRAIAVRLRRLTAQGQLLDREAAIEGHLAFVGKVGTTLDRMAADNATLLANELGVPEHAAYLALRKTGDRIREDLATYAANERDRLGLDEHLPIPSEAG